jgi:hypothetical protein
MLREDVNRIAALVGEDVGDTELLKRHQDLLDEVQSGDITEKRAREIALGREQQKTRQQQDQQTNQQAQQQAKLKRETDAGLAALDRLETELKLKDTDYVRKRAVIVPAVKGLIQRAARAGTPIPASEWAGLFRDAYDNLKLPPVTNGAGNGAQPLRGRQPAGSGKQQPKSGLEALDMALEEYDVRASR